MKLYQYLIEFDKEMYARSAIGVTAPTEEDALEVVFDKIFHNQTVPAKYTIRWIKPFWKVKIDGVSITRNQWKQRGIWYPQDDRADG